MCTPGRCVGLEIQAPLRVYFSQERPIVLDLAVIINVLVKVRTSDGITKQSMVLLVLPRSRRLQV